MMPPCSVRGQSRAGRTFNGPPEGKPLLIQGFLHPQAPLLCASLPMNFAIKANDAGRIGWISAANHRGFRSLGERADAAIFATREEAQQAIDKLPEAFTRAGIRFSIEAVDPASRK